MKKKIFGILLIVACLFLVTGCGGSTDSEKVVCTSEESEGGMTVNGVVTATLKDQKVDAVSAELKFGSKEQASQYYYILTAFASMGGAGDLGLELKDDKIIVADYINFMEQTNSSKDYDDEDMDIEEDEDLDVEEDEEEEKEPEVKIKGMSKEEFIKLMEKDDFTCK